MIIAVDFDGTIVENSYPKIGKERLFAFDVLKRLQNEGHQILLWTVRSGFLLDQAIYYCKTNGVEFYAINKNYPEEEQEKNPRKLNADLFIDDKNIGGIKAWGEIYQEITGKTAHDSNKKSWKWWR